MAHRRVLTLAPVLMLVAGMTAACGSHSAPVSTSRVAGVPAAESLGALQPFQGAVRAAAVVAYGNTVAHSLDARALFISLTGTHIDETGVPGNDGNWELQYIGSDVPAPSGKPVNPYMPYVRRIAITVTPDGHAHFRTTKQSGLPLGVSFMQDPRPSVDSSDVFRLFYEHRAGVEKAPIEQMTLSGMVGSNHFNRLVWRVGAPSVSTDTAPMLMDALTGAVLDQAQTQMSVAN